ncbi:MAG: 5-(carboxyamino)imidazole ribonucleotide mutase [Firmicutes bacterium]|nr:5-(carboxyamino)imidazole ribonucleotide mutase [Bacillota bacterium]
MKSEKLQTKVAIVMGSDSDLPVMINAAKMLDRFGIGYEIDFVSAHRTPEKVTALGESAAKRGLFAIIAGAGGAAHLPGMLAAETVVPVIGVPIASKTIGGGGFNDALPSIVQMPPGVPVATVGVNRAENAGILAAQIIGVSDKNVQKLVFAYKKELNDMVYNKSEKLKKIGAEEYLKGME